MNCWVNNREAGDLRRHRAHYDVTIMFTKMHNDTYGFVSAFTDSIENINSSSPNDAYMNLL